MFLIRVDSGLLDEHALYYVNNHGEAMKPARHYRRGYPVSLLVGFNSNSATLWEIFSHVAKPQQTFTIDRSRTDRKALYNFHETIVNALKPHFKEGVRSVILVTPPKTNYSNEFLEHVHRHHPYMLQQDALNRITFAELEGSAIQPHEVAELAKTLAFRESIGDAISTEADSIIGELNKILSSPDETSHSLFSLKEIEETIYNQDTGQESSERHLVLTDKYLANSTNKKRIHRLLQISNNKKVKTRIINIETPAGKRISQFGGIILFDTHTK